MEDTTMLEGSQGLFEEFNFTIIPNGLSEDRLRQLQDDIAAANGTIIPFDTSKGRIEKLEEINYIVAATSDFPDYYRALDLMIHVVKPTWVEQSLKGNKTKNPRTYSPDPALFMNEVVICCGSLPSGDKEAIQGGVLAMGGQFTEQLSRTVTHLISLDLDDHRCQMAISKRLNLTIVLPHWFDDCFKVGRRISERPYTLPDPEILNVELSAVPTARTSQQIRDATTPDPVNEPVPQTSTIVSESPRAIRAFSGKRVKLGEDLNLNSRLKGIISCMIKNGGGNMTSNIREADIYVCSYRDGDDYVKASQDGKDVGNLSWLYYLITHNIWTNPMRRMMHYPRPRGGVPGFEGFRISISSYTGEARVYLENLVKATGAEFTKTFKQDNTHLVAAHKNSEKCEAAQEWSVNVINHLWLEDSYAKCKLMSISDNRYTYFPSRTNLGEVLGQTEVDRDATEKMFFPAARKPAKSIKPAAVAPQPDSVAPTLPTSRAPSDSVSRSSPPAEKVKRTRTADPDKTPLPARHLNGKENETPGSRGAKDRALSKLHNAADDIAAFEKEMKRKGGVIHGGKRRVEDEVEDRTKKAKGGRESVSSKRSLDEADEDDATEDEETEAPTKNKKARKDRLDPIKYRMLVSKDDRWAGNMDKESKDKARLRELGLFITDDFKKVDILCAPKVVRTKKFVAAMACGPALVSSSYLDFVLKNNKLPPPEKHAMDTREFEKEHGFNLIDAVERATQNKHKLFRDWTIFCTEKVPGGFETYKDIIEANGGKCSLWKGRTTNITATKRLVDASAGAESQNQKEDEGDVLYLISDANSKEFANWTKFCELAKKHDMVPRIVKTEWLLINAMAQYVHWKPEWELTEEVVKAGKS
ncbi:regulator of Ty1 Transposition [Neodidymelliopsis sp. IMI 364377]|nr:regulator of Ty1 Transposition [Neodidymelliopsis sp. IMI 364377]